MPSSPALRQLTYSVADVARIFGVTASHVWRLCQSGEIPSIRLGKLHADNAIAPEAMTVVRTRRKRDFGAMGWVPA